MPVATPFPHYDNQKFLQVWEGGAVEHSGCYEGCFIRIMFEGMPRIWPYDLLKGI